MSSRSADLFVFPYLAIRERLNVGPFEIIPRHALVDDDFAAPWIREHAQGLLAMYGIRTSMADRFGCIVRRTGQAIGDSLDPGEMRPLRRAVVGALLDGNPSNIGLEKDSDGWSVTTSDNALIYLHRLDGSGHVAVSYGRMVETLTTGLKIGEEYSRVHPPSELHTPFLSPGLDKEYVSALYDVVSPATPQARRLGRAIDWLDLAWRNTVSIDDETRIVAIYSGFETLLNREGAAQMASALSELVEPQPVSKTLRPIPRQAREGQRASYRPLQVSDLEWWFMFFAFLRHDISHGLEVQPRQDEWNDQSHLFLGEAWLRHAIKRTVADAGYPRVLLDPFERVVRKFLEAQVEELDETPDSAGTPDNPSS